MTAGYKFAAGIVIGLFVLVALASFYGWGLASDAQALAQAKSMRSGGIGSRSYYGGGPGFGK
jgi:hypothetical protein